MKKSVLILIFIFQTIILHAQIKFSTESNIKIFEKAKEQNKLVAFVVETDECKNCNAVAEEGLSTDSIKKIIENNFIITKVASVPKEINIDQDLFTLKNNFFGFICTNTTGNILSIHPGSTTNSNHYYFVLNKAIESNNDTSLQLSVFKRKYYENPKSVKNLQLLIEKIISMDIQPKQSVIDDLTLIAPEDSAKSMNFIQYILKLSPLVGSKAIDYVAKNPEIYNTSWYRMDLKTRVEINNKIINKSLLKAIQEKNLSYAEKVANFKATVNSFKNYEDFQRVYDIVILTYLKGIKDTMSYTNYSLRLYETNIMKLSVDSVLRIDSLNILKSLNPKLSNFSNQNLQIDTITKNIIRTTSKIATQAGYFANLLNEGAWTIYTYTKDEFKNKLALGWAKKSVEFEKNYANSDTYARLLYRSNNIEEAILMEKEAIVLAKNAGINALEFEEVLKKMKKKLPAIDEY